MVVGASVAAADHGDRLGVAPVPVGPRDADRTPAGDPAVATPRPAHAWGHGVGGGPADRLGGLLGHLLRRSVSQHGLRQTRGRSARGRVRDAGLHLPGRIGRVRSPRGGTDRRGAGGRGGAAETERTRRGRRSAPVPRVRGADRRRLHGRALPHGSPAGRRGPALAGALARPPSDGGRGSRGGGTRVPGARPGADHRSVVRARARHDRGRPRRGRRTRHLLPLHGLVPRREGPPRRGSSLGDPGSSRPPGGDRRRTAAHDRVLRVLRRARGARGRPLRSGRSAARSTPRRRGERLACGPPRTPPAPGLPRQRAVVADRGRRPRRGRTRPHGPRGDPGPPVRAGTLARDRRPELPSSSGLELWPRDRVARTRGGGPAVWAVAWLPFVRRLTRIARHPGRT